MPVVHKEINAENSPHSHGLSVLIPAINEIDDIKEIVKVISQSCRPHLYEFIVITKSDLDQDMKLRFQTLAEESPQNIIIVEQELPGLGGAIRRAIPEVSCSHAVIVFADRESDPLSVSQMLQASLENPEAIVVASRWHRGGSFQDYPPFKYGLNKMFQLFLALLFSRKVSDYTFGFRLYPTQILTQFEWSETDHAFVIESILKPMMHNCNVKEVPTVWRRRRFEKYQSWRGTYLKYILTSLRIFFQRTK